MTAVDDFPPLVVGRFALHEEIASGGMATVHVGRLMGPVGFARTVAIKRLHPHFAKDPEFVAMFMDEARIASRIRHPNVVSILDVVAARGELLLVMDYIAGESLGRLCGAAARRKVRVPPDIAVRVIGEVLAGLHAAHETRGDRGTALNVVHRDVSPQNVLVGEDGISHLIDFGVAKAAGRIQTTREGQIKGKLAYMAPEQIADGKVDRRTDVYAAGIVLWEALVGKRPFAGQDAQVMFEILTATVSTPAKLVPDIPPALDAVVMKAIARDASQRFASAAEMADALEAALRPATSREVARWVLSVAKTSLQNRAQIIAKVEESGPSRSQGSLDWSTSRSGEEEAAAPSPEADAPADAPADASAPTLEGGSSEAGDDAVELKSNISSTISSAHVRVKRRPSRLTWFGIAGGVSVLLVGAGMLMREGTTNDTVAPTSSELGAGVPGAQASASTASLTAAAASASAAEVDDADGGVDSSTDSTTDSFAEGTETGAPKRSRPSSTPAPPKLEDWRKRRAAERGF